MIGHYTSTGASVGPPLNSTHGSSKSTGTCFDASGNLFSAQLQANTVSKFSPGGSLTAATYGSATTRLPRVAL